MIPRLKSLLSAVLFILIVPLSGYATEKKPQEGEGNQPAQEAKEDSLGIYDEENKINDPFMLEDQFMITQEPVSSESTPSPRTTTSKIEATEEEDSNSAMSFNFIYYIIDKFKLADPMD